MNILFVYAHQDTASFGAAMHSVAVSFFEKQGHKIVISDLYGTGFHAVAAKWDFKVSGGPHKNYMLEQKRVSDKKDDDAFAEDIKQEITRLREADLVVFEFPLWWSAPPAILKGWFDKVFALGVAWDGNHRYDKGLLRGKKALTIVGAGDPGSLYKAGGLHGATIVQHLYPLLHSTVAHSGMDVLEPFIATDLTLVDKEDGQIILGNLDKYLIDVVNEPKYLYKHP